MEPENGKGHAYRQFIFAVLANTVTLSYGLECGWISPITTLLQSDLSPTGEALSDNEIAWVASSSSIAAMVGVPIFAFITERYGSKRGVILLAFPQALAWILRIINSSIATLIVARVLSGISAGGIYNVVPMYIKEISQIETRGVLTSMLVLAQNIGVLTIYLMGTYLKYHTVLKIIVGVPILAAVLMVNAPESPAFLIKQGKMWEAAETLALLRGLDKSHKVIQNEIDYMRNEDIMFKSLPNVSMYSILQDKAWRRGILIMLASFTFYALNGSFTVVTYAFTILSSTGVEYDISPELQTLSIPLLMIVASVLLILIIDRCGRKVLFIGGFVIIAISMLCLGSVMLVQRFGGSAPKWLPVLAMISTMTAFSGALSPMPFLITTEIFNFQILNKIMCSLVAYAWLAIFLGVAIYSPISNTYGSYTIYFVYGACNVFGAIFVAIFLPETKGKNSEEIRQELNVQWSNSESDVARF